MSVNKETSNYILTTNDLRFLPKKKYLTNILYQEKRLEEIRILNISKLICLGSSVSLNNEKPFNDR